MCQILQLGVRRQYHQVKLYLPSLYLTGFENLLGFTFLTGLRDLLGILNTQKNFTGSLVWARKAFSLKREFTVYPTS
jgi:hypothetical protein